MGDGWKTRKTKLIKMTSKGKGGDSKADTTTMYVELSKLQQCGDHEKAVRVCNKILNSCPKDETAFHCKMVNLLQLGKFKEALLQMDTQAALAEMADDQFGRGGGSPQRCRGKCTTRSGSEFRR